MSTAARKRRFRERQADGRAVLQVEVNLLEHADMLVAAGLLLQWDAEDRRQVELATARLLELLAGEERVPRFGGSAV